MTNKITKKAKDKKIIIYGIFLSDKLVYIGSTNDFNSRKKQHLVKLEKGKHTNKTLSKLYHLNNNVSIESIIELDIDNSLLKMILEMCYISYLEPPCNKCVYQTGASRLVFKKLPKELAILFINESLNYYSNTIKIDKNIFENK